MEEEREDGEISDADSNICEDVDVYNPIARPVSNIYKSRNVCSSVPSSDNESSSSDSDSDAEYSSRPKRPKTHYVHMEIEKNGKQECPFNNRKKNNIWANVLQEEELTLEIGGVGLKKLKGDRNVESYDYTRALRVYDDTKGDLEEEEETEEDIQKRMLRKRRFHDSFGDDKKKGKKYNKPRYLADIGLDREWDTEELGNSIADALFEQKPELIVKVVQVIGQEKAIELYKSTQKVEKEGGMMIANGSRRRTSGGVYLQLLRTFEGVDSNQLSQIFSEDQKETQQWRKRKRVNRKRQKHKNKGTEEVKGDDDGLHLKGLFSDDPGGTKCPGSTPVTSPTTSDNDEHDSNLKIANSENLLLPLKEVCEKAASEISFRNEEIAPTPDVCVRLDEMETC